MSVDLLSQLMAGAKKADIVDGITENVVILEVNNKSRKNKDGDVINRNTYIKFGKLDDKGVVVAEKEVSWFNIKHDSDYAYDNLFEQLFQMTTIAESIVSEEDVDEAFNGIFEAEEVESVEDLQDTAKNKTALKNLMDGLIESFVDLIGKEVGVKSPKLRLKLTYDTKGKYIQQPKYGQFVESMEVDKKESRLRISGKEQEYSKIAAAPSVTVNPMSVDI